MNSSCFWRGLMRESFSAVRARSRGPPRTGSGTGTGAGSPPPNGSRPPGPLSRGDHEPTPGDTIHSKVRMHGCGWGRGAGADGCDLLPDSCRKRPGQWCAPLMPIAWVNPGGGSSGLGGRLDPRGDGVASGISRASGAGAPWGPLHTTGKGGGAGGGACMAVPSQPMGRVGPPAGDRDLPRWVTGSVSNRCNSPHGYLPLQAVLKKTNE